ncbi:MAG: metallophosphoesterase [Alphaproteobacteria bacterium]|nr:metallophosphoesterase [Alphaproteobacteria bacterium]
MRPRFLLAILGLVFALGLGLTLDAFWWEPSSIRLARHDVTVDAPFLKGMTIAVISDLHAGAPYIDEAKIDRIVAMTNAAHPDIILLTGDYVTEDGLFSHHMPVEAIVAHLKRLRAPMGVYSVLGNHDHWENGPRIAGLFRAAGIPDLENAALALRGPHGDFFLVGIGDYHSGQSHPPRVFRHLPADAPALCYTHSPDSLPILPRNCALTLAGHTHGGQIWLPFWGRPAVALASMYGQRYAIGTVREDGKTMFVSSGIGTSLIPARFGVPPEISFLTVH